MFRKSLINLYRIQRKLHSVALRHSLVSQKVKNCSTSAVAFKSQRVYPQLSVGVSEPRHFHVSVKLCSLSDLEIKNHMNGITDKFTEAMELLSDAASSKGTVYFSEDMTDAEALIEDVLKDYQHFLGLLSDEQSKIVVRSIGLKMEELKAQLQMLKESIKD
ncbi:embryogenesis-like protein [Ischnura elegans]|uniref:embryogenesis-like protein n=1 Tax=Ischnura elegans TaxID=197161 RepID=UPI001ED89A77|nr:embryogenesis-like protein [Ischnura elegans]